jgi:HEAT repeat protein
MGPAAKSAGPALEELLRDTDATVRESAAEAIKKIGR